MLLQLLNSRTWGLDQHNTHSTAAVQARGGVVTLGPEFKLFSFKEQESGFRVHFSTSIETSPVVERFRLKP